MTAAVEKGTADAHTLWFLFHPLVADCSRGGASATTVDSDDLETWVAVAFMTLHLALVPTRQLFCADLVAVRYRIFTRRSLAAEVLKYCLSARAVVDHIRRLWAMWWSSCLCMAALLAEVLATVISSLADISTLERSCPAFQTAILSQQTALLLPPSF